MRVAACSLRVDVPNRTLFDDLTFTWDGPQVAAVTGPSGSGKSTLLSTMMGWTRPTAGTLDVEPGDASVWFVPQNAPLLDSRTTWANLETALLAGPPTRGSPEVLLDVLTTFGLEGKAQTQARNLSGGERQRVALARAALRRPHVLLADEVTAGLDPASVERVVEATRVLSDNGTLVVIATHDQRVWKRADIVLDLTTAIS